MHNQVRASRCIRARFAEVQPGRREFCCRDARPLVQTVEVLMLARKLKEDQGHLGVPEPL